MRLQDPPLLRDTRGAPPVGRLGLRADLVVDRELLLEADEVLRVLRGQLLGMAPVHVADLVEADDLLPVEQQAREHVEIEDLTPAAIERLGPEQRPLVRDRGAEDVLPPQQAREPVVALEDGHVAPLAGGGEPLDHVGRRQEPLAGGVDDPRARVHRDRAGVRVVAGEHERDVDRLELVVGVEQRHVIGLGDAQAGVPVAGEPEVRLVADVRQPVVGIAGDELARFRVGAGVVDHDPEPVGTGLRAQRVERSTEVVEPRVEGDRDRDLGHAVPRAADPRAADPRAGGRRATTTVSLYGNTRPATVGKGKERGPSGSSPHASAKRTSPSRS